LVYSLFIIENARSKKQNKNLSTCLTVIKPHSSQSILCQETLPRELSRWIKRSASLFVRRSRWLV